jgi:hypothetical protein
MLDELVTTNIKKFKNDLENLLFDVDRVQYIITRYKFMSDSFDINSLINLSLNDSIINCSHDKKIVRRSMSMPENEDIGKEFYLFESAKYYENIYKVKLDSISKRKIKNKDGYELKYNFKGFNKNHIEISFKDFIRNTNLDDPYLFKLTKYLDKYTSIYYYIYSLDNEFVLDEINKKKTSFRLKEVNEQMDSILNSYKENKDLNKLEKVLQFIKSF